MTKIVVSDIDGTLIFDDSNTIDKRISEKIEGIREISKFVVATGRRYSKFLSWSKTIPHDIAIIEHGGIIFYNNPKEMTIDKEWNERISEHLNNLWGLKNKLEETGRYDIDYIGRRASFRIKNPDNKLFNIIKKSNLKYVENMGWVDIIPKISGKENAINYLLKKMNLKWEDVVSIGNDLNDIEMIKRSGYAFTLSDANKDIKKLNIYKSNKKGIKGTIDILDRVYNLVR